MRIVSRGMAAVLAVVTSFVVLTAGVGSAATAAAGAGTQATPHRPVIFVHGLSGNAQFIWANMIPAFQKSGWSDDQLHLRLHVWEYNWKQPNITTARQLAAEVDSVLAATKSDKVDIVAHSMGSLSSRYYLKFLGGSAKVAHWVSIGGVNHGTNVAKFPGCQQLWDSCKDMDPHSPMLKQLNSGVEAPGPTKYETQFSSADELVSRQSVELSGGVPNIPVGNLEHISMPRHQSVIDATLQFLR